MYYAFSNANTYFKRRKIKSFIALNIKEKISDNAIFSIPFKPPFTVSTSQSAKLGRGLV